MLGAKVARARLVKDAKAGGSMGAKVCCACERRVVRTGLAVLSGRLIVSRWLLVVWGTAKFRHTRGSLRLAPLQVGTAVGLA